MGRSSNANKGKGKGAKAESQYVKRVDLYKFLGKWLLRSYPDERGRPLMLQGSDAAAALSPDTLRAVLDADCCELLRRPLMGLNLSAASADGAALFAPILQEKLEALVPLLTAEEFLDKVHYLNLARNVDRDPAEAAEVCKQYLKQVTRLTRDHHQDLARAAEAAAGVYLGIISLLELGAVAGDVHAWGKAVPDRKKQAKRLQAWLQDPGDKTKLFAAVAKAVKEDLKNNTRARRFGDVDAVAPEASSSQSPPANNEESDSSSAAAPKKTKKKKDRKAKKSKAKKAAQHRKPTSSDSAPAAASSAVESSSQEAPVTKKRKSAGKDKSKPSKKKARRTSSASPTPAAEATAADTAGALRAAWPLSELAAFEEKAAQQVAAAEAGALEIEQKLALTRDLPREVQKLIWEKAGLLPSVQEDAVLKANAERLIHHTTEMVRQTRLAWVQAAIKEDKAKANVVLLSEEQLFAKLQVNLLPDERREAWQTALKGDSAEARKARAELFEGFWASDNVMHNYNLALSFAEQHAAKEPSRQAAKKLLELIPEAEAAAFGLPGQAKFEKQKPAKWRDYCSRAFTLAWHIFKAHVDSSLEN